MATCGVVPVIEQHAFVIPLLELGELAICQRLVEEGNEKYCRPCHDLPRRRLSVGMVGTEVDAQRHEEVISARHKYDRPDPHSVGVAAGPCPEIDFEEVEDDAADNYLGLERLDRGERLRQ